MVLSSEVPAYLMEPAMGDAGILALLGYAVVFLGIVFLMVVVMLLGSAFKAADKRNAAKIPATEAPKVSEAPKAVAPGAAGQLKLYNVEPKTAAMLMAIVADKMGKPLNELRFISIKEVE